MTSAADEGHQELESNSRDAAADHPLYSRSVCVQCKWHRTIVSGTGSVFMLCQSPAVSLGWPKYPPQPLHRCPHFEKESESE
jgi:hypothetical protein